MSIPENENQEFEIQTNEPESTIFADPAHFREQTSERREKNKYSALIKILSVVLVLCLVIGGYFAIDKLVPEPSQDASSDSTINIVTTDAALVKRVNVKNENSEYTILPVLQTDTDSSEILWTVENVNADYTDSSLVEEVANAVFNLDAIKEVQDTSGDFGFDAPTVEVEVIADGDGFENYTVYIGDDAPAGLGSYCKTSLSDKVYVIDTNVMLSLQSQPIDFAATTAYSAVTQNAENAECFSDGSITSFDYISVSGAKYNTTLKIKPQLDESINAYFSYVITSPTKRIGNDEQVDVLLDSFRSGITGVGAYVFDPTDEDLKQYRLDKPDFVVTLNLSGEINTFSFSIVDDLYCAFIDEDAKVIHKVALSSIAFAQNELEDYYSTFIILEALSGLKEMRVETPDGESYSFELKFTAADEENDIEQKYQAFFGGKELDIDNFKRYYQKLISLTPISYESKSGLKTAAKITLVHSADTDDVVLEFKQYSSQRYQVELDGIPMGLITATAFNELMDDTSKAAGGQTVSE